MSVFLITRPGNKHESLVKSIEDEGYVAFSFPLLDLQSVAVSSSQLSPLIDADKLIFISQDAVKSLAALSPEINSNTTFFAVGAKTAKTIAELFNKQAIVPKQQDSEGLLALKQLQQVDSQSIVLAKGKGGRPLIAKTLNKRGARLNTINLYQREKVDGKVCDWLQKWQHQKIDSIVLTSNAAIDAIFSDLTVKGMDWLQTCRFYVVSDRTAQYLKKFNVPLENIHNCNGASDDAILSEIICHHNKIQNNLVHARIQEASATMSDKNISEKETQTPEMANTQNTYVKPKGNAVAVLSLLIALGAAGGFAFNFYSHNQQHALIQQLEMNNQNLEQSLNALKSQIKNNSENLAGAIKNELTSQKLQVETALNASEKNISEQLESSLNEIKNIKVTLNPQEVRSLHRMAEFKAKIERDYQGSVAIFNRLDNLLSEHGETNDIRLAIAQDIQLLKGLKTVDTASLYFTVYGINEQVKNFPFNTETARTKFEKKTAEQAVLTEDIADFKQNLKTTWDMLKDGFIRIRDRSKPIEALLTLKEQSLIQTNIQFYLAQAQAALMQKEEKVYINSLNQASKLISKYFDLESTNVKHSLKEINKLALQKIEFKPQFSLISTHLIAEL
ncbi:hypothetical protein CJF42_21235 [Pseudoalteromonas sp. NBT06-2]|uniref:uroporphyrinogen-III C-methyltransferase n=1 Tax=Pseudoalteromonas sp. NBT06-2 TaxID=2025950 RepID=UPI000BA4FFD7|nr:uroporphyrinogen-III C-methyltransferase [Pseudoalteromonas sp. NBT06-2]PAJ72423.1 hypothetical protein CJF42_21235 [Pseudoalteromonas sp. NBT06-2]